MTAFASGKNAKGICDRCGQTYKLNELIVEYEKRLPTGLLVCKSCDDEEHPQLFLGETPVVDPQALRNARPVGKLTAERAFWSWYPVALHPDAVATMKPGEVS